MTTVSSGKTTTISSGSQNDFTVFSGGTLRAYGAGKASAITVSSGGRAFVSSGGTLSDVALQAGGAKYAPNAALYLSSGSVVSGVTAASGAYVNNHGGTVYNAVISSGAFDQSFAGGSFGQSVDSGGTILSGGELSLQTGASANHLSVTSGGILTVHSGAQVTSLSITSGSLLTFADLPNSQISQTTYSAVVKGSTLQVLSGGKVVETVGLTDSAYDGATFVIRPSKNQYDSNDAQFVVCYLAGTMIATPDGERAIETLAIGDMVQVRRAGKTVAEPIVWAGRKTLDLAAQADAQDHYPIRIRAHAIAPNIPATDLRVTPEHCVHLEGKLVPARMLVNGRSIIIDRSESRFDIFHLELARHGLLIACGLEAESYLDTGNRRSFRQDGSLATAFGASHPFMNLSWEKDAAAPLCVERRIVEPLHAALAERAASLFPNDALPAITRTSDPDLQVQTLHGTVLQPVRKQNGVFVFSIPEGINALRILSRADRPADSIGPFVDDRRVLGVLVDDVTFWSHGETRHITAHLDADRARGWHPETQGTARWTNGHAVLDLETRTGGMLSLRVVNTARYRIDTRDNVLAASR